MKRCTLFIVCGVVGLLLSLNSVRAQGSLFTYQGRLTVSNGVAATGLYDMQFKLRPGASSTNQVGGTLTNAPVGVTNGLFTVSLDFGASALNGLPLWLEIGVRTNGSPAAYTVLAPNQQITPTPYASFSQYAGTTGNFNGSVADSQLSTNIPQLNKSEVFSGPVTLQNGSGTFNGTLSGTFNGAATGTFNGTGTGTFNGTNTGTFIGNGAGVTNVNVTNITGIVQANLNWQLVQSTSQQAQVATDYMATNAGQTTLTLPASPNVGNTLRLSGSGVGGWVIAQNAGQSILTGNLGLPAGKVWTASSSSSLAWRAIASSTNGLKMVAAVNNGYIFTSTNGGQSWQQTVAGPAAWVSIASSADGTHLAAAVNNGFIYVSTNSGTSWPAVATSQAWYSIASSADGTKLAAVIDNGLIYTSVNSGTSWTPRAFAKPWYSIASSSDGTHLAAVANNDYIYTSANSGATWTTNTSLGTLPWQSIASSADGVHLVAAALNGFIYTSGDAGANWTQRATSLPWYSVSSSANGSSLIAVVDVGLVWTSFDGGQNWFSRTSGNQAWFAAAISGDGTRAVAAINGGPIYTSTSATIVGTTGFLTGSQYSAIELQYVGGGQWMPISFTGDFTGH